MVDPYVMGVIRLAERRGLFREVDISPVQEWCLKTLMAYEVTEERRRRRQSQIDGLREVMVLVNPSNEPWSDILQRLYPEIFEEEVTREREVTEITEADIDEPGEWRFEQAEVPMDEIERVLKEMGQTLTVTAEEAGLMDGEVDDANDGWI